MRKVINAILVSGMVILTGCVKDTEPVEIIDKPTQNELKLYEVREQLKELEELNLKDTEEYLDLETEMYYLLDKVDEEYDIQMKREEIMKQEDGYNLIPDTGIYD